MYKQLTQGPGTLGPRTSVKRYQQSKIGTVFQVGIAVRLQYCDNWQFDIHNAVIYACVHMYVFPLLCLNIVNK